MGNNDDARSVNSHLKTLEQKAYEAYRELIDNWQLLRNPRVKRLQSDLSSF